MGRYSTVSIEDKEYKELVKTIREGYVDNYGIKHRPNNQIATILVLEANLGCRISDIVSLCTDSIINDGGIWKLNITEKKTGKHRNFIVQKPVKDFIDTYAREMNIMSGNLFTVSEQAVWKCLRQVTDYLHLENVSTHSFRKACATRLYESTGHDIEAVCEFLQHASTQTTRRYIRRSDAQLEEALEKNVNLA